MEGYNFVEGPCPPRTIIRNTRPQTAVPSHTPLIRTQEGAWGRILEELRRFPEAFRAIEKVLCTLHPDLLPAAT